MGRKVNVLLLHFCELSIATMLKMDPSKPSLHQELENPALGCSPCPDLTAEPTVLSTKALMWVLSTSRCSLSPSNNHRTIPGVPNLLQPVVLWVVQDNVYNSLQLHGSAELHAAPSPQD